MLIDLKMWGIQAGSSADQADDCECPMCGAVRWRDHRILTLIDLIEKKDKMMCNILMRAELDQESLSMIQDAIRYGTNHE